MLKVSLIVVQGKPEGKTIPLEGTVFRIGRDETCHLRPSSDQVSRQHAEILIAADGVTLKDLGSRNGTHLNGRLLTEPSRLKAGDLIKVGPLTFAVLLQGAPAEAASAPAAPRPRSLDEVGQEEVESWLIADNSRPVPDRPSGVYDGDTITIEAYKGGAAKPAPAAKPKPQPAPAPAKAPTPAPAPPVAAPSPAPAAAAPSPAPAPPVAAPVAPAPAPPAPAPAPVAEAAPAPAPPAPAPAPAPEPAPAPAAAAAARPGVRSYLDEIESFERLPEGQGDGEPESVADEEGADEEGAAEEEAVPEEWMDESNPFYNAKKKGAEAEEAAKPSFKDSSEAADAILKKMLERRRAR